jgi:hypothetical protein
VTRAHVPRQVIQAGKFNHKASDSERREMLESILAQDPNTLGEDDGPPDDAQLNEMLARTGLGRIVALHHCPST